MTKDPIAQDPWMALSRAVSDLLARFPFYGHVLGMLARKMDPDLPCAAAIGIGTKSMLFINPDFFFRENPKKQTGILVHEIEHVIRLHIPRFEGLTRGNPFLKKKANIAMDLAVNSTLYPEILPDWVLFPKQFNLPDDQTAEWYFSHLPQPEVSPVKYRIYTSDSENHSRNASPGELVRDDFDTESVDKACGGHIPMELAKTIVRDLIQNASDKTTRSRGLVPGHIEQILESYARESRIPWNTLLRRLCQWASLREKVYTKKKRSKRYGTRPGPCTRRKLKLAVAFDTSGSVSNEDLSWFFSELDHLSRTGACITLIQCDASIQKVEPYNRSFSRLSPQIMGRGGTAITPVFEYLLEERSRIPDLLMYFTDGCGDNPADPRLFPVCWVYTPNHTRAADFGFHIEYEPHNIS
jgi:predicted metal-dependent peptidase